MEIVRNACPADAAVLARIEAICFPAAEAADEQSLARRIRAFGNHFYILTENGQAIGFINGMVTDSRTIEDEMYHDAALHRENGAYQSVFGLDILPAYRRQGRAALLMQRLIANARAEGRKGCILTCKEHLIHYYEGFGYRCLGVSGSTHGGAVWYDMILEF